MVAQQNWPLLSCCAVVVVEPQQHLWLCDVVEVISHIISYIPFWWPRRLRSSSNCHIISLRRLSVSIGIMSGVLPGWLGCTIFAVVTLDARDTTDAV